MVSIISQSYKWWFGKDPALAQRRDPFHTLPLDVIQLILSFINPTELKSCCLVSKRWHSLAHSPLSHALILRNIAFGRQKWEEYFGEIGNAPSLPSNIEDVLRSPCIFFPNTYVWKTHFLVLIPQAVRKIPFSLEYLGEIAKEPKKGFKTKYSYIWKDIQTEYGKNVFHKAWWVLMTKEKVSKQKALNNGYKLPGLLEAATIFCVHYVQKGTHVHSHQPPTFVECREKTVRFKDHTLVIGGFTENGLSLVSHKIEESDKVCAVRTFP